MEQADFGADVAGRAVNSATVATASLDDLADELHRASTNLLQARSSGAPALCKLTGGWRPSSEHQAAWARITTLGRRLFDQGGNARMTEVYDRAVEKFDYKGVYGVASAWDGIGQWVT